MPKKVYLIKLSRVRYTECILGQFFTYKEGITVHGRKTTGQV